MKLKILFSLIIISILLGLTVLIMSLLGIIHFTPSNPLGNNIDKAQTILSEDPLLLEKNDLKKQWEVLSVKESFIAKKIEDIKNQTQLLQDKMQELNKQKELLENEKKNQQQENLSRNSREQSITTLANKVVGVPPKDGALMLNDMEPEIAVEVIRAIDQNATALGQISSAAYIISLMDPAKRKDVVRMLAEFPSDIKPLNLDEQLAIP